MQCNLVVFVLLADCFIVGYKRTVFDAQCAAYFAPGGNSHCSRVVYAYGWKKSEFLASIKLRSSLIFFDIVDFCQEIFFRVSSWPLKCFSIMLFSFRSDKLRLEPYL